MRMKTWALLFLCILAAIGWTEVYAKPINHASDANNQLESIAKAVAQLQTEVTALQATVANLATSQKDQAAKISGQVTDLRRRLYATCVLTQRIMNKTVPGGWTENTLCTYRGITGGGDAITADIFGQNPTNIDTPFGGP